MPLGEPMQGLAGDEFLRDLALELDAVRACLAMGFFLEGPASPVNSRTATCRPQGRTPVGGPCSTRIGARSTPLHHEHGSRAASSFEQATLTGDTFADDFEEGTHASRSFQVGVGHDPHSPARSGTGSARCSCQSGVTIAQIAGQQGQANSGLCRCHLIDQTVGSINEQLRCHRAVEPVGCLETHGRLLPADHALAAEIVQGGERQVVGFDMILSTVKGPGDIGELPAPKVALVRPDGPKRDICLASWKG